MYSAVKHYSKVLSQALKPPVKSYDFPKTDYFPRHIKEAYLPFTEDKPMLVGLPTTHADTHAHTGFRMDMHTREHARTHSHTLTLACRQMNYSIGMIYAAH